MPGDEATPSALNTFADAAASGNSTITAAQPRRRPRGAFGTSMQKPRFAESEARLE